jgi:hypothetical protein
VLESKPIAAHVEEPLDPLWEMQLAGGNDFPQEAIATVQFLGRIGGHANGGNQLRVACHECLNINGTEILRLNLFPNDDAIAIFEIVGIAGLFVYNNAIGTALAFWVAINDAEAHAICCFVFDERGMVAGDSARRHQNGVPPISPDCVCVCF